MKYLLSNICTLILLSSLCFSEGTSGGEKFINPMSDVCWECAFPLKVASVNLTPGYKDLGKKTKKIACVCTGTPPKVGIPISFWEPARLVDVTRTPYKLLGMGGVTLGKASVKTRGTVALSANASTLTSFYQVHWYTYPILKWLQILTDLPCIEKEEFDVGYMSEYDPLWNDDEWSAVTNPEAALFGTPPAIVACFADCAAASVGNPLDQMFWCAGCQGSLYPFTGNIAHHVGGIQASSLLTYRLIAKLHRARFLKAYEDDNFCEQSYMPIVKKSLYKTQLVYPSTQTKGPCLGLGSETITWGSGKSYPYGGEDFVYLIWLKRRCCIDSVEGGAGQVSKNLQKAIKAISKLSGGQ